MMMSALSAEAMFENDGGWVSTRWNVERVRRATITLINVFSTRWMMDWTGELAWPRAKLDALGQSRAPLAHRWPALACAR